MENLKTYTGGCHCKKVRYEVKADLIQVGDCNCSFCSKTGNLLAFVPEENFKLLSGEDSLSDYQFNKKVIHHLFCKECGVRSFSRGTGPDGSEMIALNVRCLDDIDITKFELVHFDGKSVE